MYFLNNSKIQKIESWGKIMTNLKNVENYKGINRIVI